MRTLPYLPLFLIFAITCFSNLHAKKKFIYYTGAGDNLWVLTHHTTDSPETVEELLEWMIKTYKITDIYWRDIAFFLNNVYVGRETALASDWAKWCRHASLNDRLAKAAVQYAKKNKVNIYLHVGLYEAGVQPNVGVSWNPYMVEHVLRVKNPQWRSVDRWGEMSTPGAISFCYPAARKAWIKLIVDRINKLGYDGVNFYGYVENSGAKYPEQFGFEPPIMEMFKKRYPNINPRTTVPNDEQREYLAHCRGTFLTELLRELRTELKKNNKYLSMQLNENKPERIGTYWNHLPFPVQGDIEADYDTWIKEEIVDNICFRGEVAPKTTNKTLERFMDKYKDYKVTFSFKTYVPFYSVWNRYIAKGATPAFKNVPSVKNYVRYNASSKMLYSNNWLEQAQALRNIRNKKESFKTVYLKKIMKLAATHNKRAVQREAIYALSENNQQAALPVIEKLLLSDRPSIRMAAVKASAKINNQNTTREIYKALAKNNYFQFKLACLETLQKMKAPDQLNLTVKMLDSKIPAQQELAIRAMKTLFPLTDKNKIIKKLITIMRDKDASFLNRYYASVALVRARVHVNKQDKQLIAKSYLDIINQKNANGTVYIKALDFIKSFQQVMTSQQKAQLFARLCNLLESYGDNSTRKDKAYGWRPAGNALLSMYGNKARNKLDAYRVQKKDKFLAWIAYRLLYVRLDNRPKKLFSEEKAIKMHQYAPTFPGIRAFDYKY